jgi:hypothetical protein
MAWFGGWIDPELEELFRDDPELLETAQLVHASRPQAEPDPRFRNRLRGQLLAEAARGRGLRRWWRLGPAHVAWGGAAVGVVLIGATVLTFLSNHPADHTITAISDLTAQHSVNPNNVIQVRFNQPMDQQAVESGVHIQPATEVSYSWNGNNLVITPVHHLSGNTPYTVTIAQSAIRAASGVTAATPISIRFATAPTPPAAPSAPPTLTTVVVGQAGTGGDGLGGSLFFAPDGSLVATDGALPASAVTPPLSASASPTPSPTATPEGVTDNGPSDAGQLVDFPASGSPAQLGPLASAAAFSPNGTYLAAAVDDGNGGSRIVVSLSDGSQRSRLIDSPTPVTALTWSSNDRIVYTDGNTIQAVDLSKLAATLYTVASGGGTITALDPGGAFAYVSPVSGSGGGALLNIDAGTAEVLQGSTGDVAFSLDGSTVVWSDGSTSQARLRMQQVSQNAPASVSVLDPSATIGDITADQDGDEAAYLMTSNGSTQLVVVQLPSGTPLAVEPAASTATGLALSAGGDQIAFLASNGNGVAPSVEQATVPGATAAHAGPQIPPAASSTLRAFVDAQVRGDLATLAALSGPNANAADNTPQNLSRAYVISTYLRQDGGVSASIELIVDPSPAHASAEVASETLTLSSGPVGHGYVVSSILSTPLRDEATGPHVVQVISSTHGGVTILDVSFDSDLNPGSVAGAVLVLSAAGNPLPSTTVYDADSRTATVTISGAPSGLLTLEISTALDDVDGQTLAHSFQTQVGTTS